MEQIRPSGKPNVIGLVALAGFDVSDWSKGEGGPSKASTNPKYCFEWCFEQDGLFLFNIWFENMDVENGQSLQQLSHSTRSIDTAGTRKARAKARLLDRAPWTVTLYDTASGDFELRRGICSVRAPMNGDPDIDGFPEGEAKRRFLVHRSRIAHHTSRR